MGIAEVPPLILESEDDVRRFCSALQRRRIREEGLAFMNEYKGKFQLDEGSRALLATERCILGMPQA